MPPDSSHRSLHPEFLPRSQSPPSHGGFPPIDTTARDSTGPTSVATNNTPAITAPDINTTAHVRMTLRSIPHATSTHPAGTIGNPAFPLTLFHPSRYLLPVASPRSNRLFPTPGFQAVLFVCLTLLLLPLPHTRAAITPPADALDHWSFQSPQPVPLPVVQNSVWPRNEIDRFILAKLEAARIPPTPPAAPRTLIRRMTFDLTGLPPTPEAVSRFESDVARDPRAAINQLIDSLLASPAHGERWGRHWLDVARYSDTKGYVYGREERRFVHAPAYRDWVIRAFNSDLPYDRFLLLQIAADQLVPPGSPDLAAMGFLTGGRRFLGVTHDIIDDRIDVVCRTTLGLTVSCARCHDHKYDPIPTEDYYSLYGVFRAADERLVPLVESDDAELARRRTKLSEGMTRRRDEAGARLRARAGDYLLAQLELANYPEEGFEQILGPDDLIPMSVRRWRDWLRQTKDPSHPIFGPWHVLLSTELPPGTDFPSTAADRLQPLLASTTLNSRVASAFASPPANPHDVARRYGQVFSAVDSEWRQLLEQARQENQPIPTALSDPDAESIRQFLFAPDSPTVIPDTGIVNIEYLLPTPVTEELWKLQSEVDRRLIELGIPTALLLTDRPNDPLPRVFRRGSPSQAGHEVPRQFPSAIAGQDRQPFTQGSGRLELARAIVSPDNPLTARVLVNRVWQHHFGSGLVPTPSDFGLRAQHPSHPELLDWLARQFIADGWSLKTLHRRILSSATYQSLGGAGPESDPANQLLSRFPPRRLDFEQLRDAMLAVTGDLDPTVGGAPQELLDPANRRRTVYARVDRQFLPGTFRTFDFANPDLHVAVRHETTVPQQGLFFLNGPFAAERARSLASLATNLPASDRIQHLHHRLFQRNATREETAAALNFIAQASSDSLPDHPAPPPTAWRYGWGEVDTTARRLKDFTPLPHFTGQAWQGAEPWPGGLTGWAQLTAEGGHPGNSIAHACIRRWIAPSNLTVSVTGTLIHEPEAGDGIRGFIVSSRHGILHQAVVHHSRSNFTLTDIALEAGDTLDFIVDIGGNLGHDQFLWSPIVTAGEQVWDARKQFNGTPPAPRLLTPWEQYAQVLLLSNEFAFID